MRDKRTGEHTNMRTRRQGNKTTRGHYNTRSKRTGEKENTRTRAKVDKKNDIRRIREQRNKRENKRGQEAPCEGRVLMTRRNERTTLQEQ